MVGVCRVCLCGRCVRGMSVQKYLYVLSHAHILKTHPPVHALSLSHPPSPTHRASSWSIRGSFYNNFTRKQDLPIYPHKKTSTLPWQLSWVESRKDQLSPSSTKTTMHDFLVTSRPFIVSGSSSFMHACTCTL